jgi:hypothetical protein
MIKKFKISTLRPNQFQCGYTGCHDDGVASVPVDGHSVALCRRHLADEFWPQDLVGRMREAREVVG